MVSCISRYNKLAINYRWVLTAKELPNLLGAFVKTSWKLPRLFKILPTLSILSTFFTFTLVCWQWRTDDQSSQGKDREVGKRTRETSWLWFMEQRRASGITVYKYWGRLYYSSLGSLIITLHEIKYLFVPRENPNDHSVLVNAYAFGDIRQ